MSHFDQIRQARDALVGKERLHLVTRHSVIQRRIAARLIIVLEQTHSKGKRLYLEIVLHVHKDEHVVEQHPPHVESRQRKLQEKEKEKEKDRNHVFQTSSIRHIETSEHAGQSLQTEKLEAYQRRPSDRQAGEVWIKTEVICCQLCNTSD
jgi:hypothetical protein